MDFEAEDAEAAARLALEVHRDPESLATFFTVAELFPHGMRGPFIPVDLMVGEVERVH